MEKKIIIINDQATSVLLTICAITEIIPSCLINVDLPPMLGPVTNIKLEFHVSSSSFPMIVSFGMKLSPPEPHG